jgi:hypothetical protein
LDKPIAREQGTVLRPAEARRVRPPAMANGRCRKHGGASTGPRTAEGLARARWKHGLYSAEAMAVQKRARELLIGRELLKQMQAG